MCEIVEFFVPGTPIAQGSMRLIKGRLLHDKGSKLTAWRHAVGLVAAQHKTRFDGQALNIEYLFILPRPSTVKRLLPCVKPDLDKLIRAVNDALATDAQVLDEDSRITQIRARKRYESSLQPPGVWLRITTDTLKTNTNDSKEIVKDLERGL